MKRIIISQVLKHSIRQRTILSGQRIEMLKNPPTPHANASIDDTQPIGNSRSSKLVRVVKKTISMSEIVH